MDDHKSIVQEYLINSGASAEVLNAFREIDEQQQRSHRRLETAIKEQREMAETVMRAALLCVASSVGVEEATIPPGSKPDEIAKWIEKCIDRNF